jgi:hypothetical protein
VDPRRRGRGPESGSIALDGELWDSRREIRLTFNPRFSILELGRLEVDSTKLQSHYGDTKIRSTIEAMDPLSITATMAGLLTFVLISIIICWVSKKPLKR